MPNSIIHASARNTPGHAVEGCVFHFLATGKATGGSAGVMEILVPPGVGPNLHVHDDEEEQFYVLEGRVTFRVGEQTLDAQTGDFIHIPRGTPHGFKNGNSPSRLLALFIPGGLERLFMPDASTDERGADA